MRIMRRNVVLDDHLLQEAVRLSGERTYSATINRALQVFIRQLTVRQGLALIGGSNAWEGDLAEMRGDEPRMADEAWWPMVQEQLSTVRDAPVTGSTKSIPRKRRRRGPR